MKKVLTVTMDGIRYHASRPADCRHCFFWKNRKKGCVLGKEKAAPFLHRPFRFHVSGTQRTYSIMNLGIMPLTLAPKSAPDFRRECALTHSIAFGKNAQPAPERCRSERVWDFPTSILQRKICICAHECTACYNGVGSEKFTASELYRCPNLSYNEDVLRERSIA